MSDELERKFAQYVTHLQNERGLDFLKPLVYFFYHQRDSLRVFQRRSHTKTYEDLAAVLRETAPEAAARLSERHAEHLHWLDQDEAALEMSHDRALEALTAATRNMKE